MTEAHSPALQAKGKIKMAAARLSVKYPYHARVLEQFEVRHMPGLNTMGVTVAGKELLLFYCTEFVLSLSADELAAVLLHEVHHVVLGHVTADPRDFPDKWARTAAEEVTANEFVTEPLPAGGITLDQFPMLPPLESTADRYRQLTKLPKRFRIGPPKLTPQGSPGGQGQSTPTAGTASAAAGKSKPGPRHTVDDHRVWRQALKDPEAAREAVRVALQQAELEVGTAGLSKAMRAALRRLGCSTEPGAGRSRIRGDRRGRLRWRQLLRRYVGKLLAPQASLHRPPRRFPELAGVVPSRSRRPLRPRIMAVIDTSGSITDDLLELIDAELRLMARSFVVTVVECDAAVHRVYKYRPLKCVSGRGGTNFNPPLAREFLRKHRAELVVYFTDGQGPAPDRAPRVPVVWCLVPGGTTPATWGRVISMNRKGRESRPGVPEMARPGP